MIIVDKALQERQRQGNPIKVGMVGAGAMATGIAVQILQAMPGMRLAAIASRSVSRAQQVYANAGAEAVEVADSQSHLEEAVAKGRYVVTADAMQLCRTSGLDAILEVTGHVEFGAQVALAAIDGGKHMIFMNAELNATIGPILKVYADRANVVLTDSDGDQPGVIMNLCRFVAGIGGKVVLAGNIKSLHDPYRTPETQKQFAAEHRQNPRMVTSFADGTKISMEMAVVAHATRFRCGRRGMYGPRCSHVREAAELFPMDQMMNGGLVDYVLGAEPAPGVFVLATFEHPIQKHYMRYLKMGDGPLYTFYTPYHLCSFEVPLTVARAVLFEDAAVAPVGGPVCDVITAAKRDLKAGEVLDGIGGFTCYGMLENYDVSQREHLLPMGLSEGCRLKCDIPRDQVITYNDVEVPQGRLCDKLRAEQRAYFADKL